MVEIGFELLLENLQNIGFFNFFLPLLLFLAVYYGLLDKTEAVSDQDAVNGVIALSLAFLTMLGIYSFVPFSIFPQFLGALAILLVVLLGVVMVLGMFGVDFSEGAEIGGNIYLLGGLFLVALLMGPVILDRAFGISFGEIYWDSLMTILMMVLLVGAIYYMGSGE